MTLYRAEEYNETTTHKHVKWECARLMRGMVGQQAAADAAAARGPKKLSDVRVNPGIAASLGQLAPPPPAAAAKPGSSSNGALAPAAPAAPSTTDLLADLDAPGGAALYHELPHCCD